METKKTPITVLNGYLGAGKTTLLNNLVNNNQGLKIAVIVNDLAELNIDSKLITHNSEVKELDNNLIELTNGCICCGLQNDLLNSLDNLVNQKRFDYIVIESSGITEPIPIAQTIYYGKMKNGKMLFEEAYIDSMITVVDALRLKEEFNLGEKLEKNDHDQGHEHHHHDDELDDENDDKISVLIAEQIEFCNIVVLNKVDLVEKEELETIKSYVKKIQPHAQVIETKFSYFDYNSFLNKNLFDLKNILNNIGWIKELEEEHHHNHHEHGSTHASEYGISSFVYKARKPFNANKLSNFYQNLPKEIIRSKGIIWLEADNENSYILSQASKNIKFDIFGTWIANLKKKQQDEYLKQNSIVLKNWDEKYGDRLSELVIIGYKMDKEKIIKLLDDCLLDDEENK